MTARPLSVRRSIYTAAATLVLGGTLVSISACNGQYLGGSAASYKRSDGAREENAALNDSRSPNTPVDFFNFGSNAASTSSTVTNPVGLTPVGTLQNSLGLTTSLSEGDFESAARRSMPSLGTASGGMPSPAACPPPLAKPAVPAHADYPTGWPTKAWAEGAAPAAPLPMEFSLLPGQELLVIERPRSADRYARPDDDYLPGSGTLMTRWTEPGQQEREVPVPLEHTDVHASITGPISSVNVVQHFHNPYSSKIEAVYVFPLPDDAAVNDFVMTIGSRSIRGVIREREQAEQIYSQARAQGLHASLMSQERSNIFTQRVANIEPSERIDISITYFGPLTFRDSSYEFVFPMVVGPRYNPLGVPPRSAWGSENATRSVAVPNPGTGIGAIPVSGAPSGQAVDVQYLRPHERSGRDISISVDLNAGIRLEGIESPTHHINASTGPDGSTAHIALGAGDTIPNRDFVLRYRVAGGQVRAGLIATRDDKSSNANDHVFTMTIVPPSDLSYCPRGPVELVFVIDASGSMDGQPFELARRCVRTALPMLRSSDTVQVIRFSDTATFLSSKPIPANPENIQQIDRQVAALATGGGTELLNGLEPALEQRTDWKRTRFICVLSDGLLGNEPEVLGQLKKKLGDSRVFSVAIGSSPNRALMNSMARMGRGVSATVSTPQDADEVTSLFMQRVTAAAMADLKLDFGNLDEKDIYPKKLPDLFVGRPVTITGRFRGTPRPGQTVKITGRVGEDRQTIEIPIQWSDPTQSQALPLVWARARMTELDEESNWARRAGAGSTQGPNKSEIRDLALKYNLMSAYTSFIAVDCATRTQGAFGTTVQVPSEIPAGTRYDTTVGPR